MFNVKKNEDAKFYIKYNLNYVEKSTREETREKMLKCPLPRTGPLHPPGTDSALFSSEGQSSIEGGGS